MYAWLYHQEKVLQILNNKNNLESVTLMNVFNQKLTLIFKYITNKKCLVYYKQKVFGWKVFFCYLDSVTPKCYWDQGFFNEIQKPIF